MDNIFNLLDAYSIDGEWVKKVYTYSPGSGKPLTGNEIYVCDLNAIEYLPDNIYDYEILISAHMWTQASAAGNNGTIWVSGGTSLTTNDIRISLLSAITRVKSRHSCQSTSCILPLMNGQRKICFQNTAGTANYSWSFNLEGYRRLGTNE